MLKFHDRDINFESKNCQLLVTENGIKIFYELEEQSNLNDSERQKKKPSDSKSDGISIFTKSLFSQPLGFLVSNGSPVVTVGGGIFSPLTS